MLKRSGYTVIEFVVGMVLAGVVFVALYQGYVLFHARHAGIQFRDEGQRLSDVLMLRVTRAILTRATMDPVKVPLPLSAIDPAVFGVTAYDAAYHLPSLFADPPPDGAQCPDGTDMACNNLHVIQRSSAASSGFQSLTLATTCASDPLNRGMDVLPMLVPSMGNGNSAAIQICGTKDSTGMDISGKVPMVPILTITERPDHSTSSGETVTRYPNLSLLEATQSIRGVAVCIRACNRLSALGSTTTYNPPERVIIQIGVVYKDGNRDRILTQQKVINTAALSPGIEIRP